MNSIKGYSQTNIFTDVPFSLMMHVTTHVYVVNGNITPNTYTNPLPPSKPSRAERLSPNSNSCACVHCRKNKRLFLIRFYIVKNR
jgi:hypothetical protein